MCGKNNNFSFVDVLDLSICYVIVQSSCLDSKSGSLHTLIFRTVLPNKMSDLVASVVHSSSASAELSSHRFTSFLPVPPAPLHNVVMCQRKRSVSLWKAFEALECRMPLRGARYPVWGSVDCCLLPPLPCPQCPPLFYCAKSWTLSGPPEDCSQVGALLASWNTINKNPNYQRQGFDITQMRLRTYWLYTLSPEAHDISTSFCQ